ncbi:MAG: PAS domain-containing protein [bacterium]
MKADYAVRSAASGRPPSVVEVGSWEYIIDDDRLVYSADARRVVGLDDTNADESPEYLFAHGHPDDVAAFRAAWARACTGATLDIEIRFVRADGIVRHFHLRAEYSASDATRPARLWGTIQDITDHPRVSGLVRATDVARAEADEARAQAARILESVSDAFVALDREWRYTHVNAKAASIFGRTPDQMIGKRIWTEFPEGVGQPFYHAYHRAMDERVFVFLEDYHEPYKLWFESRIHPSPDGIAIFFHDVTDRHRAEEIRREWEERFRQLADNIEEVFWLASVPSGEVIYVSPAFEVIWGRPCADLYAAPQLWSDLIHPDDRAAALAAAARRETDTYDEEYRIVRPDGTVRWISDRAFPIRDNSGCIYRVAGVAQDITARHEAQDAVWNVATGLTATLESITDAFYTLDAEWRFTYVNYEAERLLRHSRDELAGKTVWSVFPESVHTSFHHQFLRSMADNVVVKFEDYYPPFERWFEVRAFPSAQGLAVYFLDVTERRNMLDELRSSEETIRHRTQQLNLALGAARIGVWSWDLRSNLVTTLQGDGPACGLPEGTYPSTGDAFKELVHPEDRSWVTQRLRESVTRGIDYQAEFRIVSPEQEVRWVLSQGHWSLDEHGAPEVMIGADLDITERRSTANELRALALRLDSVQDAERASIAREVHDDLGQALTVLRMDSTRLGRLTTENPEINTLVAEMTEVIDATLQRTRSIAMALHPSALDDLGLAAAIELHATLVARRTGLAMTLELDPVNVEIGRARAAYRVMQESLTNIVRHAEAISVVLRLSERAGELLLDVIDDGCGIKPGQLGGAGSLGLLGMRERAAAFGGSVQIVALDVCGTAVKLRLPLPMNPVGDLA